MDNQHVVVDGSNIATEGRSTPSLAQLAEAVRELHKELPEATVTVVVDATFSHRIDPAELSSFEEASLRGEYVSPPAGAIGRGDAFLLRIAEKVDGIVLSNDSFQEFHGEHEWLFDRGRLLGATPVPGIGWIFVPRTPVRGPRSRVAVRDTSRSKERVEKAIAEATLEAVAPEEAEIAEKRSGRSRSRPAAAVKAVNDPITFITFIAEHRLGDLVEAEVESFTSHGAVARYGEVRCYIPLSGLGDPAPRSAREVLRRGELRPFAITALDPHRRGVELAFPEVAVVSGRPSEETVAAEVRMARSAHRTADQQRRERRGPLADETGPEKVLGNAGDGPREQAARKRSTRKAPTKRATAPTKTASSSEETTKAAPRPRKRVATSPTNEAAVAAKPSRRKVTAPALATAPVLAAEHPLESKTPAKPRRRTSASATPTMEAESGDRGAPRKKSGSASRAKKIAAGKAPAEKRAPRKAAKAGAIGKGSANVGRSNGQR